MTVQQNSKSGSSVSAALVPSGRWETTRAVALSATAFLVFYVLSAGPMAGLHRIFQVQGFQRAIEVVYAPVVVLVKSDIEPFSSFMKWYVDLFR
ncbi:MAG: hypothetical protein ACYTGL_02265 [Planctomycetota bacterium]|jgi:hypothetical protein